MRRDLLLVIALVLLIRLPFLAQPVQGDDVYYLLIARNALSDPLHPMQMGFRYQGEVVWAAGHTRPPLNAYTLAGLLALFGEVHEVAFHLAYLLFSLAAALAMYFLASKFSNKPLLATLLFLAVPAFVVNGNKLEADIPLLAFWLSGFALFVHRRFRWAAAVLGIAGLWAYQAVFAVPILAHRAWYQHRRQQPAWWAVAAAPLVLAAWQLWEFVTAGAAPAAVLAGYFETYGLLALQRKLQSTLALVSHLGMMISPVLVLAAWHARRLRLWLLLSYGGALLVALRAPGYTIGQRLLLWLSLGTGLLLITHATRLLVEHRRDEQGFLAAWILVYFVAAVAVFYAGSARYLLPLAAPLALLVASHISPRWLLAFTVPHLLLGLALASVEYDYARQYRSFANEVAPLAGSRRVWTNAEWGLRYYLEKNGAEPLLAGQPVYRGAMVVSSELAADIPFQASGVKTKLLEADVRPARVPLRVIGPGSRSGYSSSEFGILPFDFGRGLIDQVAAYGIGTSEPSAAYLAMNAPEAEEQLLAGFYPLEAGQWRWMGRQGSALLRVPLGATEFEILFHIPDTAPARRLRVELDGKLIADETYPTSGGHTLRAPVSAEAGNTVQVRISVDKPYQPPGDNRELGIVVTGFGFK